jgi:hypothetical protein
LRKREIWAGSWPITAFRLICSCIQNSIADAVADLGKPEEIGQLFAGFQRYLDEPQH